LSNFAQRKKGVIEMSKHNRGPSLSCIICRSVVAAQRRARHFAFLLTERAVIWYSSALMNV